MLTAVRVPEAFEGDAIEPDTPDGSTGRRGFEGGRM